MSKPVADEPQVDQLLDEWEELQESNPQLSLEQFINDRLNGAEHELIEEFKRKAEDLASIDQHMQQVAAAPPSVDQAPMSNDDLKLSALRPELEPIPGYYLVSRLGCGGFGEVWKATAPGGFSVALKFVQIGGRIGDIEQRSLDVIKEMRHPNLLAVVGTWCVDDLLVIATELADGTLLDRLHEVQKEGRQGIPRSELLKYFIDAAKGIDYLNNPRQRGRVPIQHRDIKPQNLLLSGGSVKVGDFGLARPLQGDSARHTGAATFSYAAPENFDGATSSRSDQYSLAVSYCHLRGGRLPFDGNYVQIMDGHRTRAPDLSMLPAEERPVVARVLSKLPADRWPSCVAFVRALIKAGSSNVPHLRESPIPPPVYALTPPPVASPKSAETVGSNAASTPLTDALQQSSDHEKETPHHHPVSISSNERNRDRYKAFLVAMALAAGVILVLAVILATNWDEWLVKDNESAIRDETLPQTAEAGASAKSEQNIGAGTGSSGMQGRIDTGKGGRVHDIDALLANFPLSFVRYDVTAARSPQFPDSNPQFELAISIDFDAYERFVNSLEGELRPLSKSSGQGLLGLPSEVAWSRDDGVLQFGETSPKSLSDAINQAVGYSLSTRISPVGCVVLIGERLLDQPWGKKDEDSRRDRQGGERVLSVKWYWVSESTAWPLCMAFRRAREIEILVSKGGLPLPPIRPIRDVRERIFRNSSFLPGGPAGAIFSSGTGGGDLTLMGARNFYEGTFRNRSSIALEEIPLLEQERVMLLMPGFLEEGRFTDRAKLAELPSSIFNAGNLDQITIQPQSPTP